MHRDSDSRNVLGDISRNGQLMGGAQWCQSNERVSRGCGRQRAEERRTRIKPTHSTLISGCCSVNPLMLSTRNSDVTAESKGAVSVFSLDGEEERAQTDQR